MAMTGIKSKPLDQVRDTVPVKEVTKGDMVRLNMNITEAERAEWKMAAIRLKTDVTSMVHAAMNEYLSKHLNK